MGQRSCLANNKCVDDDRFSRQTSFHSQNGYTTTFTDAGNVDEGLWTLERQSRWGAASKKWQFARSASTQRRPGPEKARTTIHKADAAPDSDIVARELNLLVSPSLSHGIDV